MKSIRKIEDKLREFSKVDPCGSCYFLFNIKENSPYFLSSADRDSSINLWKMKKKS